MAGLFGDLLSAQNLPQLSLAASLLSGKKGDDIGLKVSNFANAEIQQQNQERLNRANDLQQLQGVYNILKQQEFSRMLAAKNAGIPFTPNPAIDQVGQRILSLSGAGNLSGGNAPLSPSAAGVSGGPSAPSNFGASAGPVPTNPLPASVASQYSPVVKPQYQAQGPMPQPTPQPTTQANDPFGGPVFGIDPTEFALTDPSGQSYMKALLDQAKPITTRYGVYRINPRTGQVELAGGMIPENTLPVQMGPDGKPMIAPLPGQLPTQSALSEATSRGKSAGEFPYRVEMVKQADGRVVPTLVSNVTGMPNAQPSYSQGPQSPQIPPAVAAADASGKPFVATQAPGGPVQFQQPPSAMSAANDPWATMPKIPQTTGIGQSTEMQKFQELRPEFQAQLAKEYGNEAQAANDRKAYNQQALNLVQGSDTGFFASNIAQYRNILATLGVPGADNKAATDQALAKNLVNTAIQRGGQAFKQRFTQGEVNLMTQKASPSPDMQRKAIEFLLQSDNAQQDYLLQRAGDFGRYSANSGDPLQFQQWYARTFPMKLPATIPTGMPANHVGPQISGLQVTFPSGNRMTFPSQTALQAWKKQAGIQ